MKVLFVGASGAIGSEALIQCLADIRVTSVVAFVRRPLPEKVSSHPKLNCVTIEDFSSWSDDILREHADAAGMIWAMGTNTGNVLADLEYPLIFITSMAKVLESQSDPSRRQRFRYVHLSGKFVRQDQDTPLYFLEVPRKMKGLLETRALAFADSHASVWQTFIVKPGGVVMPQGFCEGGIKNLILQSATVMGENWSVKAQELGAFMTHLAVDGDGEERISENARIVRKGRELLEGREREADGENKE